MDEIQHGVRRLDRFGLYSLLFLVLTAADSLLQGIHAVIGIARWGGGATLVEHPAAGHMLVSLLAPLAGDPAAHAEKPTLVHSDVRAQGWVHRQAGGCCR